MATRNDVRAACCILGGARSVANDHSNVLRRQEYAARAAPSAAIRFVRAVTCRHVTYDGRPSESRACLAEKKELEDVLPAGLADTMGVFCS